MNSSKKVYVIGAGFGGMAAALRLRAKGYEVEVLERGNESGGRARVFKQEGHTFDAGPTVITAPYLIEELFALFDKKTQDYLQLKPLDHWYRYQFEDGTFFDYVKDEAQMLTNIAKISSADVEGFKKLTKLSQKIFDKGFTQLSDKPFFTLNSMLKQAPALMKLGAYKSVYRAVGQYLSSEKLRRVFTTQPLLVGGDPFKTTSIYLLILHLEQKYGCHFCMGGTTALVNALTTLMQEVGITIRYNATVTAFKGVGKKLSAVCVNHEEYLPCDMAVFNGDPAYAYHHLIPKKNHRWLTRLQLPKMQYSMGLCLFYFGTTVQYENVPLHTISYGSSYRTLLEDVFHKKNLNLDLSIYLYRPTAIDKSLAPAGKDSFYALLPVPNLLGDIDWSQKQKTLQAHVIQLLEERLLPNLSNTICTQKFITPEYFQSELLSLHGSGFSIQPIFTQSAYLRFHNRAKKLQGLYFVGAGTHPGAGVPGVLSSAKLVGDLIPEAIS